MEVFTASTPTSSGNYKANLEGLQDETPGCFRVATTGPCSTFLT